MIETIKIFIHISLVLNFNLIPINVKASYPY